MEREKAYREIHRIFEGTNIEGLKDWLVEALNTNRVERGLQNITIDVLDRIEYGYPSSKSSTEVAGEEISRPVITFPDSKSFKRFYAALQGIDAMHDVEGVIVALDVKDETGMDELVGLIFTSATETGYHIAGHEIKHSIDPYVFERKGYNMIISEAFALFGETVVEPWGDKQEIQPLSDEAWNDFESRLLLYYKPISNQLAESERMSQKNYTEIISEVVTKIKASVESSNPVGAQRWLVQQKKLEDIISV